MGPQRRACECGGFAMVHRPCSSIPLPPPLLPPAPRGGFPPGARPHLRRSRSRYQAASRSSGPCTAASSRLLCSQASSATAQHSRAAARCCCATCSAAWPMPELAGAASAAPRCAAAPPPCCWPAAAGCAAGRCPAAATSRAAASSGNSSGAAGGSCCAARASCRRSQSAKPARQRGRRGSKERLSRCTVRNVQMGCNGRTQPPAQARLAAG